MFLRKSFLLVAVSAILVFTMVACAPSVIGASVPPALAAQTQSTAQPANAGITVSGIGQVSGTPDIARVTVGIESQGNEVKQVVSDNNAKMAELIAGLKGAGISDKDIQTMNYSVYVENPRVEPVAPTEKAETGSLIYHVSNQVQITVRDISKLSSVLDLSVENGANSIYGVSFDVSNPTALEDQAREIAVANAKARAEKLAKLEGLTLGSVIHVEEISGSPVMYYGAAKAEGLGGGAPIESGSIQVTVNLQVTYGIK